MGRPTSGLISGVNFPKCFRICEYRVYLPIAVPASSVGDLKDHCGCAKSNRCRLLHDLLRDGLPPSADLHLTFLRLRVSVAPTKQSICTVLYSSCTPAKFLCEHFLVDAQEPSGAISCDLRPELHPLPDDRSRTTCAT
jgi:hypothetical protein